MKEKDRFDWDHIGKLLSIATQLLNFPKYRPIMDEANRELDAIANPPKSEEELEEEDLISRDVTESKPGEPPPPDQSHLDNPPAEPAPLPIPRMNPPASPPDIRETLPGQPTSSPPSQDPRRSPPHIQPSRDDSPASKAFLPPTERRG